MVLPPAHDVPGLAEVPGGLGDFVRSSATEALDS